MSNLPSVQPKAGEVYFHQVKTERQKVCFINVKLEVFTMIVNLHANYISNLLVVSY